MKKRFPLFVKITLIAIYLIFLAGAIVRMTGSGMGCPDWPKCFGYFIPPTSEEQITWQPNTDYKEGIIIIKDEALYVAEKEIKTNAEFNSENWNKYTKHDYVKFNKFHTWTEYINRLTSVLAGIPLLLLVISSFFFWRDHRKITFLSLGVFFLFAFEAWLGKTVVDTNLTPVIITIHMIVGLVIIALLLLLRFIVTEKNKTYNYNSLFNKLLILSILFSLIQIVLGTQVRQFIDEQIKTYGFDNKEYSLMDPNFKFYFHRSFTIAIVLVNLILFYLNQIKNLGYKIINWVLIILLIETMTGILMYYAEFPMGTQAVHLLSGAVLFGVQFYLWLQNRKIAKV